MATNERRRCILKLATLLAAAPVLPAAAQAPRGSTAAPLETPLRWLDGTAPASFAGTTWGVPWPQGHVPRGSGFRLAGAGTPALQSWPLAHWPDGSVKWSAHAIGPAGAPLAGYALEPISAAPAAPGMVTLAEDAIVVDTGPLQCRLPRRGSRLIGTLALAGRATVRDGELVVLTDDANDDETATPARRRYRSEIEQVEVEQDGPVRAVLKATGTHRHADGTTLLPFTVRLYFYRGADTVRLLHTLVVDVDPARQFVRGVGLRFGVPLDGAEHERYVRFVGANGGVFAESVRGITGLRRDPGAAVTAAQRAGQPLPPAADLPAPLATGLQYVPAFGDYRLLQASADGFTIEKRTAAGHGWVHAASGTRAAGTGYLGGRGGGVVFGVRHFWQSHPGQIDIGNAAKAEASVTLWLWAPQAPPMDLRFYHDGMGQDSHRKQREGLDITYEDYEPGFGTPQGIARTSEVELQLLPATPGDAQLAAIAARIEAPPRLVAPPERLHAAEAFGPCWAPAAAHGDERTRRLQARLASLFEFYRDQVEQRRWYGFWDYGDVMHTYDASRHMWRYDVGGFAWDNSELSTDIWLWHYFLHSGRADAFRLAEAMTRHTGEVDVHHIGRFAPLGTRHGVQHWGDSAKQLRISTALNRRFLYYLAADERIGDLLDEQVEAVRRLRDVVPGRKIGQAAAAAPGHASVSFGTDWGAIAAAWFVAWERRGGTALRDRLLAGMASIAAQPHGFFTGAAVMNLDKGAFLPSTSGKLSVSHLSAVFGLTEICAELLRNLPEPAFRAAWLDYCRLYNATPEQQRAALGQDLGKLNLGQGHARLLGYAAAQARDPVTMAQAWRQFEAGKAGLREADFAVRRVRPPAVLAEVDEAPGISTNAAAQWGLGALGLLALDPLARPPGPVLVRDDFARLDAARWRIEAESDAPQSAAAVRDGTLVLDTTAGLTVWLAQPLRGHYEIAFTRTVLDEGGPHDRVSDLNVFWQAQTGGRLLSGRLADYDRVPMYYAGIGGNGNTTTRFRRLDGSGTRELLQEYTAAPYLLRPNRPYRIRIVVDGAGTRLYVDGVQFFGAAGAVADGGWFGLRTTKSRQQVSDFVVYRL
ncbi:exo-rhamnogalacturonan lyase family protein [Pseudoduganella chitinolytica]|uniref:DUF6250 domain-containing protein n=1 Tax=Pseudoduganella chitinolytica TaxID=34070 RepID=A0ABY8BGQ8_9BURK|nr:DUF6250 domain-containing protein [Pseudoduganella chitinolytica]WEF35112.1 DUF6250 domain-containing protein [Pseudoduganella chitinolytica]